MRVTTCACKYKYMRMRLRGKMPDGGGCHLALLPSSTRIRPSITVKCTPDLICQYAQGLQAHLAPSTLPCNFFPRTAAYLHARTAICSYSYTETHTHIFTRTYTQTYANTYTVFCIHACRDLHTTHIHTHGCVICA